MTKHKINKYSAIIDSKDFKSFLETIDNKQIINVIENLKKNIELLESSLILPVRFVQSGIDSMDFCERFRWATQSLKPEDRNKENIEKEMQRLSETRDMTNIGHTFDVLDKMLDDDNVFAATMENMFRLNTLHLWTIFEVFSQDLWIKSINAYPGTLGKGAFENKKEKCTNQLIREFTDNNFNLNYTDSMGDFLSNYVDFSGVKDIIKAYRTSFGKTFAPIERKLLQNKDLLNLQMIRNQIIHKSGIVDKTFITTVFNLKYKIGDVIVIDGIMFESLCKSVLTAIREIIEYIDFNLKEIKNTGHKKLQIELRG